MNGGKMHYKQNFKSRKMYNKKMKADKINKKNK